MAKQSRLVARQKAKKATAKSNLSKYRIPPSLKLLEFAKKQDVVVSRPSICVNVPINSDSIYKRARHIAEFDVDGKIKDLKQTILNNRKNFLLT
jgi:hypothetical protein